MMFAVFEIDDILKHSPFKFLVQFYMCNGKALKLTGTLGDIVTYIKLNIIEFLIYHTLNVQWRLKEKSF